MRSLRVLSFAVSLCIICGIIFGPISASALYELEIDPWGDLEDVKNPGITDTPMVPDAEDPVDQEDPVVEGVEGGIALMSLDDSSDQRYVSIVASSGIATGGYSDSNRLITRSIAKTIYLDGSSYYPINQTTYSTYTYGSYMAITAGAYFDYLCYTEYPVDEYESITFSGSVQGAWKGGIYPILTAYPDKMQLVINGEVVGDVIEANSDGYFEIPVFTYEITEDVTNIGYRFTTTEYVRVEDGAEYTNFDQIKTLGIAVSDGGVISYVQKATEPEYNGLLGTIIGWLQSLWDAITGLPDKIVDGLLDGLSGLFVPSEEDITAMQDKYDALLQDRLGFIYQGFDATVTNVETIVTNMEAAEEYSFTVPEISFTLNGQTHVILEETPVSLDNDAMDVLRGLFGTAVCVICVGAWLSLAFDMVVALISGIGYFEFLTKRKEEELYE